MYNLSYIYIGDAVGRERGFVRVYSLTSFARDKHKSDAKH